MKILYTRWLIALLLVASLQTTVKACPAPGTYTIGPSGDYLSLTQAIAAISSCTITGAYIFEFKSTYTSAVETFPLSIPYINGSSSINTITFRPQASSSGINITSSNSTGTLLFNGATNIFFDGRAGGAGTTKNITIQNTSTSGYAVQFINDASFNSVIYCNVRSANTGATSGTVVFSTAGTGSGNDNNTISDCALYDAAAGTPANALYQSGSASPALNNNNSITNNSIYNFFSASSGMNGIYLANNASAWSITGNSFYQTATRNLTGSGNIISAIQSASNTVNDLTITGNFIGGTAALAGSTALTITGSGKLNAIMLITGTAAVSNVLNNTIRNISFTSSSSGVSALINLVTGKFNAGTTASPNVIGTQSGTNSIAVSFSNSAASPNHSVFAAIYAGSGTADIINIQGNSIGGIAFSGSSTTAILMGIYFSGTTGTYTVDNNIIGSISTASSITSSLNTFLIPIYGNVSTPAITQVISNNTISNIATTSTATANQYFYGILTQGTAVFNTTGNTICNLSSASTSTLACITGIYLFATTTPGQVVSKNVIYNISGTAASAATLLIGISYNGPSAGINIISGNLVHSFNSSTTNISSNIFGIYAVSGTSIYQNNMVRLGIKNDGSSITTGNRIFGIAEKSGSINNYYFNSVYIGGTCNSSASKTYAFHSLLASGTRSCLNNIFFNARSSSTSAGGGRHYGCLFTTVSGLTSNYNDIIATGTDKMLGSFGSDISTLAAWRTATSSDANSISSDPKYIAPTAAGSSVDLHINNAVYTLAEGNGTPVAAVANDYDLQSRAAYTPHDIGADAIINTAATRIDAGATGLSAPTNTGCYSSAETIKIAIKNYGSTTINFANTPVTVTVNITGAATQTLTGTISSSTLAAGNTADVTMCCTVDMTVAGTYTFNATVTSVTSPGADADITNDAMTIAATRTATGGPITWLGVNTNWNDASNWCNGVPDATKDATIPNLGVGGNYPTISNGNSGAVKNITISTNASVTTNAGGTLTIAGIITNNGSIASNGDIVLSGTSNTNFPGTGTLGSNNNLTISKTGGGTVTFNKAFTISGVFTPTSGNIIINNTVTLSSSISTTARVGIVGAAFTYGDSGNFDVQRYYPARRAWRLATCPVSVAGNIYDNWQNGGLYGAGNYNKGTLITGPGAAPLINGLDVSAQNNPSLKSWDTTTQNLVDVTNTFSTDLSANSNPSGAKNTGYFIFIRGDRNASNTNPPAKNITTLSGKGYLQTGIQVFNAAAPSSNPAIRKNTLIGNPYASPIDFGQLVKTNLLDQFYAWDPLASDVGRYVTVTRSGGGYVMTPNRAGGPDQYIQSGQAFYVQTGSAMNIAPSLTIQEGHKVSNSNLTIFRPSTGENKPEGLRINLLRQNADGSAVMQDGVYILFDKKYSNGVGDEDAFKFPNITDNLSIIRQSSALAVEKRQLINVTDTIYLDVDKTIKQQYSLEFEPGQLNKINQAAFLEDASNKTSTPLNMDKNTVVDFTAVSDMGLHKEGRFRIIFRPSVVYSSVNALIQNNDIAVQWEVTSEKNIEKFQVERSADGSEFISVSDKPSAGDAETKNIYQWLDKNPAAGTWYYRIKSISKNGVLAYSDVAKVILLKRGTGMYVYPNPVTNNSIALQMSGMQQGDYKTRLINETGQVISSRQFAYIGGNFTQLISLNSTVAPGTYQLEIMLPDNKANYLRVLVTK